MRRSDSVARPAIALCCAHRGVQEAGAWRILPIGPLWVNIRTTRGNFFGARAPAPPRSGCRTNKINQGGREKIQEAVVHAAMTLESQGSSYVVRYFSSWFESGQLFIQMELCQGTLRDAMQQMCEEREDDPRYREAAAIGPKRGRVWQRE